MNYQELSPQGETLLKEIIDLQASGGGARRRGVRAS